VLGSATGGSRGTADDDPVDPDEDPVDATVAADDFDASDRPGATAETSAAKPAVRAAVPTITQRRVRPTRASAASRASAARDWVLSLLIRCSLPIMTRSGQQTISVA
jgi:hypothetical protein